MICQSLHIDKIYKNDNSFLIIPTFSSKYYFCHYYCIFQEPGKGKEFWDSCSWNLSKCKTFSPASRIVQNNHNDEELELLECDLTFSDHEIHFLNLQGSRSTDVSFVKKKNLLSEDDEVDFISCCDSETFKFVVPPKKYKINIFLHALVSGAMCGLCLLYLLPTTLHNLYYNNTGMIFSFSEVRFFSPHIVSTTLNWTRWSFWLPKFLILLRISLLCLQEFCFC